MTDFRDLMRSASDSDPGLGVDPQELVRVGRRRVRRRGLAVMAGVTAASLAVVGGALWLPGAATGPDADPPVASSGDGDGDTKPDDRTRSEQQTAQPATADYERVEVSAEEAARRCGVVASNHSGGREDWFEVDDKPSYVEGRLVDTGSQGNDKDWPDDLWGGPCTIPQADMLDQAGVPVGQLPDVDDLAGIREACGTRVGWDLAGWRVLTAASTTDQLFAFLRSADEHVATCSIEFGTLPALDVADRTGNGPTSARVGIGTAVLWGQGGEDSDMLSQSAAGRLSHSGAARVVFTTAGGERQSVPVVDGYYTWVSVLETSAEYDQVAQVTVLDAQGNVLHEQQEIVGTPPMTREDPAKG